MPAPADPGVRSPPMDQTPSTQRFTKEQLDAILAEVAGFSIDLEDDPTLPHLGTRYLQKAIASCRNFTNRVTFYIQSMTRMERELIRDLKIAEMDLDFKMQEKLADDAVVRKQPSIEDRKALAASLLKDEQKRVADLRIDLLDLQESIKIAKFKHGELQRTSNDIKTQRALVKDDMQARLGGGGGYDKPQIGQDKSVQGGLPPPVSTEPIDPKDILDPNKRPEDLPEPVDEAHAKQIAAFFSGHRNGARPAPAERKPTGENCSVCGLPQWAAPGSGVTCDNGHGGAEGVSPPAAPPAAPEPEPINYDDLIG